MQIRLHGTATENAAALAVLGSVLDIRAVSRPYPDRSPSQHERIYLDVEPPPAQPIHQ
ncbi:MAG: hypothetical protein ACJ73S_13160 [Mycobacteriales bacterium]